MRSTGTFNLTATGNSESFSPGGKFKLTVRGGTTINTVLQSENPDKTFDDVPNADGLSTITDAVEYEIYAAPDDIYRFNTTTVTGTWAIIWKRLL